MKVTRDEHEGFPVLTLTGEFDSFETGLVREAIEGLIEEGRPAMVVDLGPLSFANSTTIAYMITAQKRAREAGGRIVLARPQDFIHKTLRTLGLEQVFRITDSVPDAVSVLREA